MHGSNYLTFGKKQNYGDRKKVYVSQGLGDGGKGQGVGMNRKITGVFRMVKILCMIFNMDIYHYTFVCRTPRVNPNVNYEL